MSDLRTDNIGAAALAALPPQAKPKNVEEAARQFEALLIGQMLRSVREASTSDDDQDNASATMLDVADQQFSQLLAHNGGLGLAQMIAKGLRSKVENAHQ